MSIEVRLWGTNGRIVVDRQEIRTYIRDPASSAVPVAAGWRTRNITELTAPVNFYMRGEEYSAQIDHFVDQIVRDAPDNVSTFATAAETDAVVAMIRRSAEGIAARPERAIAAPSRRKPAGLWGRARALLSYARMDANAKKRARKA